MSRRDERRFRATYNAAYQASNGDVKLAAVVAITEFLTLVRNRRRTFVAQRPSSEEKR